MSQNLEEEGLTHTGEAFLEFVYDLLEYAIPKYNYKWSRPADSERNFKKIFRESFGDAIILFRNRHKEEFKERMDTYFNFASNADIEQYSIEFCKRTLKGNIPLMELIAYFAFLLDSSLSFLQGGEITKVFLVTDEAFGVFYKYVERFFTIVGGWHALYQVAKQYVDFVNFTPSSIVSESASEVAPIPKL